ncbi:MAG: alpha-ketoglutarate-dependent 2,4-dichlorophenoxyacetate dioxygenase [Gammaproteobacteria bacterium]|jgi:alpha-ketoglutarate-dependent 2,4-dichlorophenoxyacetate dioxygenase
MATVMELGIRKLTDNLAAQVDGVDLTEPLDDASVARLRSALDDYSVLVFRNQHFDNESQIAFSTRFGPLENMLYKREGDGNTPISNITNVDFRTDEIFLPGHVRLRANSGNEMWHTDSSFKPVPALCSMLSGREVPPHGGDTQFASCRAAYEAMSPAEQQSLDGLVAEHSYAWSRSRVPGYEAPAEALAQVPPVRQAVLRSNPGNGRKNFYTGAHASHILGWPVEKGRKLLQDLVAKATQPQFVYEHKWQQFDFVVWDNRCVLHRATAFESEKHRRVMRRTTVAGTGPTVSDTGEAIAAT